MVDVNASANFVSVLFLIALATYGIGVAVERLFVTPNPKSTLTVVIGIAAGVLGVMALVALF